MSKTTKVWLVTAALLIVVGCILFIGVMAMLSWDFTKLSTVKYETNTYTIQEEFKSITIVADTADIVLVPSEESSVTCYEETNAKHTVTVNDGTLTIKIGNAKKWYQHIGINFGSPKITVCLPQGEYTSLSVNVSTGDVEVPKEFTFEGIDIAGSTGKVTNYASSSGLIKIKTSTGNINVSEVSAGAVEVSVSTGKITASTITCEADMVIDVSTGKTALSGITCQNLRSSGNTGSIALENVVASQSMAIERTTGDVTFKDSDAAELFVVTDTGDVTGNLLSRKAFVAQSDTGRIDVPKTVLGGRCEITTDTGDIRISTP